MFVKTVNGVEGEVTIPSIGASIGSITKWTLQRREDRPSGAGVYVFRAVFSYFFSPLWNEEGYQKQIRIRIGDKRYQVEALQGSKVSAEDPVLYMEEVELWPVEEPQS